MKKVKEEAITGQTANLITRRKMGEEHIVQDSIRTKMKMTTRGGTTEQGSIEM